MKSIIWISIIGVVLFSRCKRVNNNSEVETKDMFDEPVHNPQIIECFATQFKFSFRFPGNDNILGDTDYNLFSVYNPLGIVSEEFLRAQVSSLEGEIKNQDSLIRLAQLIEKNDSITSEFNNMISHYSQLLEDKTVIEINLLARYPNETDALIETGTDDFVLDDDLHLIVRRPVTFKFRSKDVIHSAYFPHFRAQMNCVPGQITEFTFTPSYTAEEYSELEDDHSIINSEMDSLYPINEINNKFDFMLICNKVCGSGHIKMNRKIIVETELEFEKWYECIDWNLPNPVEPRLDINNRPVIYKGWDSPDAVGYNITNLAITK